MPQSRLPELLSRKSVSRSASYINPNISSEDVNKIARALNEEDRDTIANTIWANTNEHFLGRLFEIDEYASFIDVLGKEIVNANSHKLSDETRTYVKAGAYKQIIPAMPKRKVYAVKNIEQKSRKGTTYKRTTPSRFSVAEKGYIERSIKLGLPNKQIVVNFNKYFKPRSKHSIITKKRRLKNAKDKRRWL